MLPLLHNPSCSRPHSNKIGQTRNEHRQQRRQYMQPILRLKDAGQARRPRGNGCPFTRVCQGEDDRKSCLHGEVDGEDSLLKGRELGPRQRSVGYYASYEGLKDLRSEESAIAGGECHQGLDVPGVRSLLTLANGREQEM